MKTSWTAETLRAFEADIAKDFEAKKIPGPIHLSGGNEEELISIFEEIGQKDWIFATYRSHYHALLHGIPDTIVRDEIVSGRSMNMFFPARRFYTSAIVGGMLSIAVGTAAGLKRSGSEEKVWCFIGDMAATTGGFHEAERFARRNALPITFVIEDNGLSTNSPTVECWGRASVWPRKTTRIYVYKRAWPHVGSGQWVQF